MQICLCHWVIITDGCFHLRYATTRGQRGNRSSPPLTGIPSGRSSLLPLLDPKPVLCILSRSCMCACQRQLQVHRHQAAVNAVRPSMLHTWHAAAQQVYGTPENTDLEVWTPGPSGWPEHWLGAIEVDKDRILPLKIPFIFLLQREHTDIFGPDHGAEHSDREHHVPPMAIGQPLTIVGCIRRDVGTPLYTLLPCRSCTFKLRSLSTPLHSFWLNPGRLYDVTPPAQVFLF